VDSTAEADDDCDINGRPTKAYDDTLPADKNRTDAATASTADGENFMIFFRSDRFALMMKL
jgi:hypothetical protein